jgi:hypothetical protein
MKFAVFFLSLTSFHTLAQECSLGSMSDMVSFGQCLSALETATAGPAQSACGIQPSGDVRCDNRYNRLLADGTINITMARGYGDTEGSANDFVKNEYYDNQVIEGLTSPCPSSYGITSTSPESVQSDMAATGCGVETSFSQTCGFQRGDDPEIFTKQVVVRGRPVSVRLRMLSAALSTSDSINRGSRNLFIRERICQNATNVQSCVSSNTPPNVTSASLLTRCVPADAQRFQLCRSDYVRRAWAESIIKGDEIVMYNGHARSGGGPSFDPPKVLANGHVDYDWYRSVREGHKQETEAFRTAAQSGRAPVFYASHSCSSGVHFIENGNFPEVSPTTSYVTSGRTTYTDEGVASTLATLESAFQGRCQEEFSQTVQGASCGYDVSNF